MVLLPSTQSNEFGYYPVPRCFCSPTGYNIAASHHSPRLMDMNTDAYRLRGTKQLKCAYHQLGKVEQWEDNWVEFYNKRLLFHLVSGLNFPTTILSVEIEEILL